MDFPRTAKDAVSLDTAKASHLDEQDMQQPVNETATEEEDDTFSSILHTEGIKSNKNEKRTDNEHDNDIIGYFISLQPMVRIPSPV